MMYILAEYRYLIHDAIINELMRFKRKGFPMEPWYL